VTPEDIRTFQAGPGGNGRYDWEGKRLAVDGDLGPRTRWALAMARLDPRRQAIVERAGAFVGLIERATNRGPDIDTWLERCGAPLGSPWCAAFASWCLSVHGMPLVREAGAQALGRGFPATACPEPGDVMWFPTGAVTGHCGIVIGVGPIDVATIEGNQDNAVRVVRRARNQVRFASVIDGSVAVPPGLALVMVQHEGTR
jgi:hypothetical protein